MVGTESCQKNHVDVCVSENLIFTHEDGSSVEVGPVVAYTFDLGHNAWVLGNEEFVGNDFDSYTVSFYAKN